MMHPRSWSVVRVTGGSEFAVVAAMIAAEVEAYCPAYTERRPKRYGHRGEFIETTKPLYPTYIFAKIDSRARTEPFETSRIRISVLALNAVSEAVVESVRAIAEEASKVCVERRIEPGDFVTMLYGVLKGESARVVRVRGQQALIDIQRDGRRVLLQTKLSDLTKEAAK